MRSKKRLKVKNAVNLMKEHQDKYCDLVWYARNNSPEHLPNENYRMLAALQNIKQKFPEEVNNIGKDDNWNHGFNSGMLAASRLFIEMIEGNPESALELFPFLDS